MKKIYTTLLLMVLLVASCHDRIDEENGNGTHSEREIELKISDKSPNTRAPQDNQGAEAERKIKELDLIVFDFTTKKFKYTRQPFRQGNGTYKVTMPATPSKVDVLLIANARSFVTAQSPSWTVDGTTIDEVRKTLIDANPTRLIDTPDNLPMSGLLEEGEISQTGVTKWGPIQMLRSVASVKLTVEKSAKTNKLEVTGLQLYFAPTRAYLLAFNGKKVQPETNGITETQYAVPANMATTLTMATTAVENLTTDPGTSQEKNYYAITNKMYLYENDVEADKIGTAGYTKKFTRVILAGKYNNKATYYPIDFAYSADYGSEKENKFRPILRNWKYVFNVTAVHGPGYDTPDEAANNYPINLDFEIIDWNMEDEHIGVTGKYYVSVERKKAILSHPANSKDRVGINYKIEDLVPGDEFTINFKDPSSASTNGEQTGDSKSEIQNNWFIAKIEHDTNNSKAILTVTARKNYDSAHAQDIIVLRFRNLEFEIEITQIDDEQWGNGGDIPSEL